jgi:hypothetical protein
MILKEVTEDLTPLILFSSFMSAFLPCLSVGPVSLTSPTLISVPPYSTHHAELHPKVTGTVTLKTVGRCVCYTTRVLWSSVCVNCYFLQQIPVFSSLNNKHSTRQSHPLKVNDKDVTDKMEIASRFNIFYHAQPKLEPK